MGDNAPQSSSIPQPMAAQSAAKASCHSAHDSSRNLIKALGGCEYFSERALPCSWCARNGWSSVRASILSTKSHRSLWYGKPWRQPCGVPKRWGSVERASDLICSPIDLGRSNGPQRQHTSLKCWTVSRGTQSPSGYQAHRQWRSRAGRHHAGCAAN